MFDTPQFDESRQQLYVEITTGRGHIWLNGYDLGRYWNITRGDTTELSMSFYLLPYDLLLKDKGSNELVVFDVFGGIRPEAKLVLSWIVASDFPHYPDEVDFPGACI